MHIIVYNNNVYLLLLAAASTFLISSALFFAILALCNLNSNSGRVPIIDPEFHENIYHTYTIIIPIGSIIGLNLFAVLIATLGSRSKK